MCDVMSFPAILSIIGRHFKLCRYVNWHDKLGIYSELDSSGSVKKLTKGVSLKRKSAETVLYILFNKLFL